MRARKKLSIKQERILSFIHKAMTDNVLPPTVRYIQKAWKVDIEATAFDGYDTEAGRATGHDILHEENGLVYEDNNVSVEAYRTKHASLQDTFGYRFMSKERIVVFTGDGG